MNQPLKGHCLCGSVRFEIDGPLRPVIYCHCGQCRRSSGHFAAATATQAAYFRLLANDSLRWYRSSERASRGFCERCGSNLFWRREDRPELISIFAGCLDQPTGLCAAEHIHTGKAGDYYRIADGLPRFIGDDGGVDRQRPPR